MLFCVCVCVWLHIKLGMEVCDLSLKEMSVNVDVFTRAVYGDGVCVVAYIISTLHFNLF